MATTPASAPLHIPMSHIGALQARIGQPRFAAYIAAAGGDPARALRLYEWNIAASAAFQETLGQLEVLLRNALDEQLRRWHRKVAGGDGRWHLDPATPLHGDLRGQIDDARRRARKAGAAETHDRVIAELMFGFWRYLLDARHQATLWAPALRHAFPHLRPRVRTEVYDRVERLHALRNRIAHHEPIHSQPLAGRLDEVLTVAGCICPTTATWIWSTTRVPHVLAAMPTV
jgi:hypothetical protein